MLAVADRAQAASAYLVEIQPASSPLRAGASSQLQILVRRSADNGVVRDLEITHDEFFHVYVVSEDLRYYAHEHAQWDARGFLRLDTAFPRAGMYRLVSEYQPRGATTQFTEGSLYVAEARGQSLPSGSVTADTTSPQSAANTVLVSLRTEPSPPRPGIKTPLIFSLKPAEGLEKFHGDWGQLLVVSDDLIDMIRAEPAFVNGAQLQFNVYFPRPRTYRVWLEYRHSGALRRERIDLDVRELR